MLGQLNVFINKIMYIERNVPSVYSVSILYLSVALEFLVSKSSIKRSFVWKKQLLK